MSFKAKQPQQNQHQPYFHNKNSFSQGQIHVFNKIWPIFDRQPTNKTLLPDVQRHQYVQFNRSPKLAKTRNLIRSKAVPHPKKSQRKITQFLNNKKKRGRIPKIKNKVSSSINPNISEPSLSLRRRRRRKSALKKQIKDMQILNSCSEIAQKTSLLEQNQSQLGSERKISIMQERRLSKKQSNTHQNSQEMQVQESLESTLLKCKAYDKVEIRYRQGQMHFKIPFGKKNMEKVELSKTEIMKINPKWLIGFYQGFWV